MVADVTDVPLAADDGLAAARAQFNNPFSQLKSMFPYMADDSISGALAGRDIGSAMLYLPSTLPVPQTPMPPAPPVLIPQASGSGQRSIFDAPAPPSVVNLESAADFIFGKLSRVFVRKGEFPRRDLVGLLASNNGDLASTVAALQSAGLKFSWPEHELANDWRDWADAAVTPAAPTPVPTPTSNRMCSSLHSLIPTDAPRSARYF